MKKLTAIFLTWAVVCLSTCPTQAQPKGQVYGWGSQKLPNEPLTDINQISAGEYHSLVLKSDGSIVGWGYDKYGQATPPAGNDYIAIDAGGHHSLALRSDGSVVGWGRDVYGQATPPDGNDFIAIAAGLNHSLGLKSDGSIVGWGSDSFGKATPPEGNDYIAIAAGERHSLALKVDGSIVGWGSNDYGQAIPPESTDFFAIAAGRYHSLALKSDGSIVGWGHDYYATPPAGTGFIAIAASLALRLVPVVVEVKITPSALYVNSKGQYVVAHIQMPEDLVVAEDDIETILLDGVVEAEDILIGEDKMITARFSRSDVSDYLIDSELFGTVELTVTCRLTDHNVLKGKDPITVKQ